MRPVAWPFVEAVLAGEPTDECIIWPYSRSKRRDGTPGYGTMNLIVDGQHVKRMVHEVMLERTVGPRPPGLWACHSCGRGMDGCVNPRHLRWDTRSANEQEKLQHGTDNRGTRHGLAKLTEDEVREIRRLYQGRADRWSTRPSQREIAEQFGVHQVQVSRILLRKDWWWLP